MKKFWSHRMTPLMLCLSILNINVSGQSLGFRGSGPVFSALGGCGMTLKDISAAYGNQAGLAEIKKWKFDVSLENKFAVANFNVVSLAAAVNSGSGVFGCMFTGLVHSSAYTEQKLGLSYARKIHQKCAIGGQLDLLNFTGSLGSNYKMITFEAGLLLEVSRQINVAMHTINPMFIQKKAGPGLHTQIGLGLRYIASPFFSLLVEVEKNTGKSYSILRTSLIYNPNVQVSCYLGVNPSLRQFGLGFSYKFPSALKVFSSTTWHQYLGLSPGVSIQYGN